MVRICLIVIVGLIIAAQPCMVGPAFSDSTLIPVKPSYQEASYQGRQPQVAGAFPAGRHPTPREQMYVFWILGKVLSYPIDQLEAIITRRHNTSAAKPIKASAPSTYDPFKEIEGREIPPAPPVLNGPTFADR